MENSDNAYSHNFWGFYCRCDKFYDTSTELGVMIQCFVCNDWFHDACIGKVPDEEVYSDYICPPSDASSAVEDDEQGPAKKKARSTGCRLRDDAEAIDAKQPFDLFMIDGWKEHVCTCIDCMRGIESNSLTFLLKEEDVVEPEEDESRSESIYESALRQLQTMDRAQAVDAAAAYHSLSSRLKDYLRPFAASGKVVTNQDIHTFFEQHSRNNT
ncbi:hypothetical protein GGF43_003235 [Coemansia sp. RSA 2618]|nr:hypothetical protein GGF43_003235 [Coemansia sp. RSA 2618]